MTAVVKTAQNEDRKALEKIWTYCFSDSEKFRTWYFDEYWQPENTLIVSADGLPAASLQLIPTTIVANGRIVNAAYIVGVDCLPQYRGRGYTRALMEAAMGEEAARRGLELLTLMPFEADFYLPYGFAFGTYHYDFDIDINEFYRADDRAIAQTFSWETVTAKNLSEKMALMEMLQAKWSQQFNGSVVRSERQWKAFVKDVWLEDGHVLIIYDAGREARGYLAYSMSDGCLRIKEMVCADEDARACAYYFVAGHRSQVKRVEWSAPEGEWLAWHRRVDQKGVSVRPFMMYRLLRSDAAAAFAARLPEKDLYFICEKRCWCWLKDSRDILPVEVQEKSAFIGSLSIKEFNRIVFDRGEEPRKELRRLKALFEPAVRLNNNEYF